MAQKLFVNNTGLQVTGQITVRTGDTPGQDLNDVSFTLSANEGTQQYVTYGDASSPYMDALEISAEADGAVLLSQQIVIARGSSLDNEFNMNDTIYIGLANNQLAVTTANTWTV